MNVLGCGGTAFLTSTLDGGKWSTSRHGCFTHRERAPGANFIGGWVGLRAGLDAVVKRKKFSASAGTRTPYHIARSPALHRGGKTPRIFNVTRLKWVLSLAFRPLQPVEKTNIELSDMDSSQWINWLSYPILLVRILKTESSSLYSLFWSVFCTIQFNSSFRERKQAVQTRGFQLSLRLEKFKHFIRISNFLPIMWILNKKLSSVCRVVQQVRTLQSCHCYRIFAISHLKSHISKRRH